MPTYDFKCENNHIFDIYLKKFYNEKIDIINCPHCNAPSKRLFSKNKISWILVGNGWAKDGYGNTNKSKDKND